MASGSAIRKIRDSVTRANVDSHQTNAKTNIDFWRGVADNNYVSKQVAGYLKDMNQSIASGYADTGESMALANKALYSQLQGVTDSNRAAASADLERLGLQGVGLGGFDQDANFTQLLAKINATNEQQNNKGARANSSAVGKLLAGMNQGSKQQTYGRLRQTRNDAHLASRQALLDYKLQARQQINEILAQQAEQAAAARASGGSSRGYSSYGGGSGGNYISGSGGSSGPVGDKLNLVRGDEIAQARNNPAPLPKNPNNGALGWFNWLTGN